MMGNDTRNKNNANSALHPLTDTTREPQFPAQALNKLPSVPDISADQEGYSNASKAATSLKSPNSALNMEPLTPGGHRRRRSSVKNGSDDSRHGIHLGPPRAPKRKPSNILEGNEDRSQEDSMSPSDERTSEDDDGILDDEETGLTATTKSKRRSRKRRNTLLDERIVPSEVKITAEEQRTADQSVIRQGVVNGALICLWYFFSLTISLYNKWMFDKEHLNFPFPLFTTCTHMLVQFCLASLVLYFMPQFRPRPESISNPRDINAADEDQEFRESESMKPLMTKQFYLTRIGPCGMATGLDIGLGNFSLRFITLTFYTMCKSSSLAFVLLFAFLFRLETPSIRLVGIISTMTVGVLLMVAGEVSFSTIGFILIISAAFFSGFRWGLTQILLLRNPATSNPFSSIFYLAPIMFATLLIIAIPLEGFPQLLDGLSILMESKGPFLGPVMLLLPGVIAFLMTASEFALLQRTSVVTLSIAGIFKEVVTITAAGLKFHDPLSSLNVVGLFVTIGAIAAYNYIKIKSMREAARTDVHNMATGNDTGEDHGSSDADGEDEWEGSGQDWSAAAGPDPQTGRTQLPSLQTGGLSRPLQSIQGSAVTPVTRTHLTPWDEIERVGLLGKDLSD